MHLEADVGGAEPVRLDVLDANYTYNVYPMFKAAGSDSPNAWTGLLGSEVREKCIAILAAFDADPAKYRALNPESGWGNFEGAREFIRKIADACEQAPLARVCVL